MSVLAIFGRMLVRIIILLAVAGPGAENRFIASKKRQVGIHQCLRASCHSAHL